MQSGVAGQDTTGRVSMKKGPARGEDSLVNSELFKNKNSGDVPVDQVSSIHFSIAHKTRLIFLCCHSSFSTNTLPLKQLNQKTNRKLVRNENLERVRIQTQTKNLSPILASLIRKTMIFYLHHLLLTTMMKMMKLKKRFGKL